ncbi:MAG: NAD(P)-dependent oxidoreductase [Deltaproteobacteria bacterium]|nr:NAD(P)-dependent oxidoreductase [Deltaproteobacteria bacterium]
MKFEKMSLKKNLLETNIGFIGIGMMGDPMAQNLLKGGFKVMVYDVRPEAMENARALGAKLAQNASEMACCDLVFIMTNTGAQVQDVIMGEQGIIQGFKGKHQLRLVVMSTVSPILIKNLASTIGSKSITFADAPVSGLLVGAQQGSLTFMVGGQKDTVEFIRPYLKIMGKNIFYIGPLGSGLAMKLLNNVIGLTIQYLFPEALKIGIKAGLDVNKMVEVIKVSTGNSWPSDQWSSYVDVMEMMVKDPKLHKTLNSIAIKDFQSALEWAEELKYEATILKAIFPMIKIGAETTGVVNKELFKYMDGTKIKVP